MKMWRAIGTGLGFAVIGLTMLALAVGAGGITPPASTPHGYAASVANPVPNHRLEIYPDPAGALTETVTVP